jgi:hypothetical protein
MLQQPARLYVHELTLLTEEPRGNWYFTQIILRVLIHFPIILFGFEVSSLN